MNKTLGSIIAVGALALSQAHAAQITGSFGFAGTFLTDNEDLNLANSLFISSAVVNTLDAGSALDLGGTTDLDGINVGDAVTVSSPWNPGSVGSSIAFVNPVYSVGGFQLDLATFTNIYEDPEIVTLKGTGTLSGNGYDATPGNLNISFTRAGRSPNVSLTFSATSAGSPRPPVTTPDGGSTAMLLGFGLMGAAAVRRKLS